MYPIHVWIHVAQDWIGAHYLTGERSLSVHVRGFLMNDCDVLNKDCTMQLIICVSEIIIICLSTHTVTLCGLTLNLAISLLAVLVRENKLLV